MCSDIRQKASAHSASEQTASDGALHDLIHQIYETCAKPHRWPEVLDTLGKLTGGKTCVLACFDHAAKAGRIEHTARMAPAFLKSYRDYYASRNILRQKEQGQKRFRVPGTVWRGRDIVAFDELVASEFYTGWLEPQGIYHMINGVIDQHGSVVYYVGIGRARRAGDFDDHEAGLLRQAMPHLQRALQIQRLVAGHQAQSESALRVLDHLPIGAVLLDENGKILTMNTLGKNIVTDGDGLALGPDGLEAHSNGESFTFRDLLAGYVPAGTAGTEGVFSVPRTSGRKPLSVLISPVKGRGGYAGGTRPAAVVLVKDPERHNGTDSDKLRQRYNLTVTEAKLAVQLVEGQSLEKSAAAIGISYHTARTHLKHIFTKTGTGRQAELMHLVLTGSLEAYQ